MPADSQPCQLDMSLDSDGPCPLGRSFFAELNETGGEDSLCRDSLVCGFYSEKRGRQRRYVSMDVK